MRRRPFRGSRHGGVSSLIVALGLAAGAGFVLKPGERSLEGRPYVVDGDTIHLNDVKIRLKGIDAPEMEQSCYRSGHSYSCGQTSRRALIDLVSGRSIQCRSMGRDRYQRVLARCTVQGNDIGARLVEEGWAVSYGRDYEREESDARSRRAGLWSGEFERPQDWRRQNAGRS